MPSFKEVLSNIAKAWREDVQEVDRVGNQVLEHIRPPIHKPENRNEITTDALEAVIKNLIESYDWGYGGWGSAPKFPQPMTIEFLLHRATTNTTQREQIIKAVTHDKCNVTRRDL